MPNSLEGKTIGILLAAGKGSRFDPQGLRNKLLAPLANGVPVAAAAAANLLAALPDVLAVVRPGEDQLASVLAALGCRISVCQNAEQGMGVSLVHALSQTASASCWVIALADMPYVDPVTIRSLSSAVDQGATIAVPTFDGVRGNPVAFGREHLAELLALGGDEGARRLLRAGGVTEVVVRDPGVRRDIDLPGDI